MQAALFLLLVSALLKRRFRIAGSHQNKTSEALHPQYKRYLYGGVGSPYGYCKPRTAEWTLDNALLHGKGSSKSAALASMQFRCRIP